MGASLCTEYPMSSPRNPHRHSPERPRLVAGRIRQGAPGAGSSWPDRHPAADDQSRRQAARRTAGEDRRQGPVRQELETALLEGAADIAVHSMKDVPMDFPEGLGLYTICEREDPRDAFVSEHLRQPRATARRQRGRHLQPAPPAAAGFLRRLTCRSVSCGQRQCPPGQAGCRRIRRDHPRRRRPDPSASSRASAPRSMSTTACPPADRAPSASNAVLPTATCMPCWNRLHHTDTAPRVTAERALNKRLNGGCQVPDRLLRHPRGRPAVAARPGRPA